MIPKKFTWTFLLVACLVDISICSSLPPGKTLYDEDSLYYHIRVTEVAGYRYLSFDRTRGNQSAVNIKDPYELKFAYTRAMFVSLAFVDRIPERILYIGLGGASMPKVMHKHFPDMQIDIAEIDADVLKVARRFFFFKPDAKMEVFVQDGRQFLRRNKQMYDMILLDAYNNEAIPFHLTTKEFYEIVKSRLKPDGVVAANIWGPRTNRFYLSQIKTYQQVFPRLYVVDTVTTNNYIFIATPYDRSMSQTDLQRRITALENQQEFSFRLLPFVRNFEDLTYREVDADVLIDDFAPVESLRSQKVKPE